MKPMIPKDYSEGQGDVLPLHKSEKTDKGHLKQMREGLRNIFTFGLIKLTHYDEITKMAHDSQNSQR